MASRAFAVALFGMPLGRPLPRLPTPVDPRTLRGDDSADLRAVPFWLRAAVAVCFAIVFILARAGGGGGLAVTFREFELVLFSGVEMQGIGDREMAARRAVDVLARG